MKENVKEKAEENCADGLQNYVDIRYIDPQQCQFEWTENGFLSLSIGRDEQYPRVNLHRAFPLSKAQEFISVRDGDGKEIGIIESLDDFAENVRKILLKELDRRYFLPDIQKIITIREEFGYSYWDVQTDAGPRRFTVRSGHGNVAALDAERVMVIDADGNRFLIPDMKKLSLRESKLIEPLLTL